MRSNWDYNLFFRGLLLAFDGGVLLCKHLFLFGLPVFSEYIPEIYLPFTHIETFRTYTVAESSDILFYQVLNLVRYLNFVPVGVIALRFETWVH
jgi:hypothetical protein